MELDGEGFRLQGRNKGKQGKGAWGARSPGVGGQVRSGDLVGGEGSGNSLLKSSENRFSLLSSSDLDPSDSSFGAMAKNLDSKARYMNMLPNGDFDPEKYEDEKDWDDEEDMDEESQLQWGNITDKRGAAVDLERVMEEDNKAKKGRLQVVASTGI